MRVLAVLLAVFSLFPAPALSIDPEGAAITMAAAEGTAASTSPPELQQRPTDHPAPPDIAASPVQQQRAPQVFNLQIEQFADVQTNIGPAPETQEAGKRFSIPIEIVNAGNGNDSFRLESGFPRDYRFYFAAASTPDIPIATTPMLAAGEKFSAVGVGTLPCANADRQKNTFPVKIISSFAKEATQSREIVLVTSAPLLRSAVKSEKERLLPGDKISYRISLQNIGTGAARGVVLRVDYPPQYEPVAFPPEFGQEKKGALVLDGLTLKPDGSNDYKITFQLKDDALADQELFVRADVINAELQRRESVVSATSVVQRVSGVAARSMVERAVVIPGQVLSVPVIVTNAGNVREVFSIRAKVPEGVSYAFIDDVNRDGKRQPTEPLINHVRALSPREESYVVLELSTPPSAHDGAAASAAVIVGAESDAGKTAAVSVHLLYSRPILELTMDAKVGRLRPGDVSSLELNCVNRGSSLAKDVDVQSVLPAQLELVAADPSFSKAENGVFTWRFDEFGAGEKRNIRVTYRVRPGVPVGTNMQLRNLLSYHDQMGNRY